MNLNPAELLNPIFNALDNLIANDGVYLYLVFVWLALAVVAWIISGGLRKRMNGNSTTVNRESFFRREQTGNQHHSRGNHSGVLDELAAGHKKESYIPTATVIS